MYVLLRSIALFFVTSACLCLLQSCNLDNHTLSDRGFKDKVQIEEAIIDNIESMRLSGIREINDKSVFVNCDTFPHYYDPSLLFWHYALRQNIISKDFEPSPKPTYTQMEAHVDKLLYSDDSLRCAATIVIDVHFDSMIEYKIQEFEHEYGGYALYGFRENKDEPFNIYPIPWFHCYGFSSDTYVKKLLKSSFFSQMKGHVASTGNFKENMAYPNNFGDKDFFLNNPDFKKDSLGNYWCEFVKHGCKIRPANYFSNRKRVVN